MNITVLFPTATEASLFSLPGVTTVVSGVGLTATAYATLKAIQQHKPDVIILAGVAGVYPHAGLQIGDVVLVASEVEGDLGFFTPEGFTHLAHLPLDMAFERRHTLACPALPAGFAQAKSVSLNAALAPFIDSREVEIENMEGAAFFHVCLQEGQRFVEIRAISNVVKPGHDDWDLEGSVRALTDGLHRLIDVLQREDAGTAPA
ncbi:purine or other phosphorylase family 1 [Pseudogulbenkiania sp. NH8B]|uniref:phosphorylase family protein n=1 Tax=Pseudogulbenkiania sp. (strain NH8B) TaxID=748280 RepID=UPI0002279779|nr:purine or other phosphorylase family 1 [Pseudogulbenkiania sp. NH8B]BAK74906.1 purine or other phosphorylase family 1 [Pseudogulbenkiania sp. NH8B]